MLLGVGLAFLATRTDMPGGRFVGVLALMPMLVPPSSWSSAGSRSPIRAPASSTSSPRGSPARAVSLVNVNTMPGIIWVTGLFLTPYVYLLVAAGFRNSDAAMEEAARVSGAGR
jgi:iron(III) transport system permease protein